MKSARIVSLVVFVVACLASASLALTAYGVGSVTGRVGAGLVSDRVGTFALIRAGYVLQTVALAGLPWVSSREALLAVLVVFGIGFAASDTMITRVVPDVFGLRAIGAIMGLLTLGWRCGAAMGPAVAGFVYDARGSYAVPFGVAPVNEPPQWSRAGLRFQTLGAAAKLRELHAGDTDTSVQAAAKMALDRFASVPSGPGCAASCPARRGLLCRQRFGARRCWRWR